MNHLLALWTLLAETRLSASNILCMCRAPRYFALLCAWSIDARNLTKNQTRTNGHIKSRCLPDAPLRTKEKWVLGIPLAFRVATDKHCFFSAVRCASGSLVAETCNTNSFSLLRFLSVLKIGVFLYASRFQALLYRSANMGDDVSVLQCCILIPISQMSIRLTKLFNIHASCTECISFSAIIVRPGGLKQVLIEITYVTPDPHVSSMHSIQQYIVRVSVKDARQHQLLISDLTLNVQAGCTLLRHREAADQR